MLKNIATITLQFIAHFVNVYFGKSKIEEASISIHKNDSELSSVPDISSALFAAKPASPTGIGSVGVPVFRKGIVRTQINAIADHYGRDPVVVVG